MAESDRLVAVDSSNPILPAVVVAATEATEAETAAGTLATKFITPRRLLTRIQTALAKVTTVGGFNLRAGGTPKYHVDEGDTVAWINEDGSVFFGQNHLANYTANNAHRMHPDFLFDQRALRLFVRNITMGMIADPCDLALRRWGPDTGGFPYVADGTGDGTFADLTGLGPGSLVGQIRMEPATVVYGGDQDTPGAQADMTSATLGFSVVDMPRRVTTDSQCSAAGKFEVNLTPKNSHDFRQTYFQVQPSGQTYIGNKAVDEGNRTAFLNIRVHEGQNNSQLITITGSPTGGTFKLIFHELPASTQAFYAVNTDVNYATGYETATIAFDASAATVQTAIVNAVASVTGNIPGTATPWSSVTNSDVGVTGSAGGPWTVEFQGLLATRPMFKFGKGTNALTGGTSPNFTIERVNEVGIATQAHLHILRIKGCTGLTGNYIRVKDDADADVWILDANKDATHTGGSYAIATAGKGLKIKEGSNAKMGTAVLVGGTATVSTTAVAATSRVFLTSQVDGGTPGFLRVSARVNGTSFTITSSSGTDTSTVAWVILDPA